MERPNNYAFIDSQNLYRGVKRMGWKLDWARFRVYLREKYHVTVAYLFIGYIAENASLYAGLQRAGFVLIFKPILRDENGYAKGNVDADLVLQAALSFELYTQAVIVSSDGDYYSLVQHLYKSNKLCCVISPEPATCSVLIKKTAKERLVFLDTLRHRLEQK